jgi:NADH dehydrogenase/NADH:ubiquinone oxidoreductase subunit G
MKNTNLIKQGYWHGVNILNSAASDCGKFELGIQTEIIKKYFDLKFLYIIGEAFFKHPGKDTFVVYQGHHGNNNALEANLILPGSAFTEKIGTFVNLEGYYQNTNIALLAPLNAREDWKILYALIEKLGFGFQKEAKLFLYKRLSLLIPSLIKANNKSLLVKDNKFSANSYNFFKNNFVLLVKSDNFYMADSISRASPVMAKCSKSLLNKQPFF